MAWFAIARVLCLCLAGCGLQPLPRDATSYGSPHRGVLLHAASLPDQGEGFVRAKRFEDTRWGSPELVALIQRVAGRVAREFPGAAPLYVGDIAAKDGGEHHLHGSHRTGRDVDVLFYLSDLQGRSVRGSGFYAFDARGVSARADVGASLAFFDDRLNWAFVRELLRDERAPVQWIFCSDGVKARLLSYGADHEIDPAVLLRAAYVLHQPSSGAIHDDHFHVRIACRAEERARGCSDYGPIWPWLRESIEKPEWTPGANDDDTLLTALLGDGEWDESLATSSTSEATPAVPATY